MVVKFQGNQRPYLAYGIPRIRVADEDLVMEQSVYEDMLHKRESITYSWESQKSKYKISDIDLNIFKSYLKRAKEVGRISFENEEPKYVMEKLGLSDGEYLLNAGAALFVDCGINELQMAKFASDERLTFTDIRRFIGSIFDLANKAVQYVVDAMDWRVEFDGSIERKEIPEIPVEAIREAVVNAFVHRLIESGQAVEVTVYRSYIEIYSAGKFPSEVTPEMFINGTHKPIRRNPLITRTMYYSKDMESFATGLKHIQDLCDESGCKVEFYGDDSGFNVKFYRHCGEGWDNLNSENEPLEQKSENGTHESENGTHENENGTHESENGTHENENGTHENENGTHENENGTHENENGTHESGNSDDIENSIINLIMNNNKITRQEIADILSISPRTVQRIINSIDELYYVGSGKFGHWEIKSKKL